MMRRLCYSALDIAAIIRGMELHCRDESQRIDLIWEGEQAFLASQYRKNQRKFILDVRYWLHYFDEKPILDKEFPAIQKDIASTNGTWQTELYVSDFSDLDLFFKNIRIRILYGGGNDYIRIKLRTLLKQYGYQRRSKQLIQHINQCMFFYHLEATLRGGVPCRVDDVELDKMLTFRVI